FRTASSARATYSSTRRVTFARFSMPPPHFPGGPPPAAPAVTRPKRTKPAPQPRPPASEELLAERSLPDTIIPVSCFPDAGVLPRDCLSLLVIERRGCAGGEPLALRVQTRHGALGYTLG